MYRISIFQEIRKIMAVYELVVRCTNLLHVRTMDAGFHIFSSKQADPGFCNSGEPNILGYRGRGTNK